MLLVFETRQKGHELISSGIFFSEVIPKEEFSSKVDNLNAIDDWKSQLNSAELGDEKNI